MRVQILLTAAYLLTQVPLTMAQEAWQTQAVGDMAIQVKIVAAAAVGNDPMHALEREIHRGMPGAKTYHVLVQVSDRGTGRRQADVTQVWATVRAGDPFRVPIQLRPMQSGGDIGYGNFLDFEPAGPYLLQVQVWLDGRDEPVAADFHFAHLE